MPVVGRHKSMSADHPKYSNGDLVRVGDVVSVAGAASGEVVFVVERNEFAPDFPAAEWVYLGCGFMVRESDGTLVHYKQSSRELRLLSRVGR